MSSVLCNMKRVSITFLPFIPVSSRARVQTPSYTTIVYATAANTNFHKHILSHAAAQGLSRIRCMDITNFLTKPLQYFPTLTSQTVNLPI